jgi:arginine/lysine/ornithine decarboxylase
VLDQLQMPLVAQLQICAHQDVASFHTPGHQRGQGTQAVFSQLLGPAALRADLPELPELDNLFAPSGAIRQAQELAAQAFGADQTWFLVNGSTAGVIAAILATCQPGDRLILPRNVHQSAISGLILAGAEPVFVMPTYDADWDIAHGVTTENVAAACAQHPDAKALFLVDPTYYGTCADVRSLVQVAHQAGMPCIVDAAHGAHLGFHPELPPSALQAGADLVIQSTHKTLSALTQAAMLHRQGGRIDPSRISRALQLVQSTSPNYLLLASLDAARQQIATQGYARLSQTLALVAPVRSRLANLPGLTVLEPPKTPSSGFFALDRTRLTVGVAGLGLDGFTADEKLRQAFGVICELPAWQNLTFIFGLGTRPQDADQLVAALATLSAQPGDRAGRGRSEPIGPTALPSISPACLSPRQAFFAPTATVGIGEAIGEISAELVCPYPPGIPVLWPGEVITEGAIDLLQAVRQRGGGVTGCADSSLGTLQVIRRGSESVDTLKGK